MRKPVFSICKKKFADQLHGDRHIADNHLCFHYIVQPLFLNQECKASSHLVKLYSQSVSDLIKNPVFS